MCCAGASAIMQSIRPSKKSSASRTAIQRTQCYTEPAPADEVMMEQLEFLLQHVRHGRHAECPQCARLDRVGSILLAPFL
jgi:hypothetical protein